MRRFDFGEQRLERARVGDVDAAGVQARMREALRQLGHARLVGADGVDDHALGQEPLGQRQADAARGAGDDGDGDGALRRPHAATSPASRPWRSSSVAPRRKMRSAAASSSAQRLGRTGRQLTK